MERIGSAVELLLYACVHLWTVKSILHFAIGHNPKPSPTPVFPRTDGEKWTQRHARLHGNAANKTARISGRQCQVPRPIFYISISLQSSSPVGSEPGGKYLQQVQSQIQEKFMKEYKKSGIFTEQQIWPQLVLFSECWLFCPLKTQTGFLRPILISDGKGSGLSEGYVIICFVWSTSLPLTAPFLFSMLTLLLPIIFDTSYVLSFPSTVYIPAYLSAPHTAHHFSCSQFSLEAKWETAFMFTINPEGKIIQWPCLCSSQSPSKLGKLAAIHIIKTWESFLTSHNLTVIFYFPCWARKTKYKK